MQEIKAQTIMSRYEYTVAKNRNAIADMIKQKMAMDIAHKILEKVTVRQDIDQYGDTRFTLRFYTTTSREEADMINELEPIIRKMYLAMTSGK